MSPGSAFRQRLSTRCEISERAEGILELALNPSLLMILKSEISMPAQSEVEFLGVLLRSNTRRAPQYARGLMAEYVQRTCPNGTPEQKKDAVDDFLQQLDHEAGHLQKGRAVIERLRYQQSA